MQNALKNMYLEGFQVILNYSLKIIRFIPESIDMCHISHMTPVALPQHRSGAGLNKSSSSQFLELR